MAKFLGFRRHTLRILLSLYRNSFLAILIKMEPSFCPTETYRPIAGVCVAANEWGDARPPLKVYQLTMLSHVNREQKKILEHGNGVSHVTLPSG